MTVPDTQVFGRSPYVRGAMKQQNRSGSTRVFGGIVLLLRAVRVPAIQSPV